MEEPRFPDAGLAHESSELAVALLDARAESRECVEFRAAAHEASRPRRGCFLSTHEAPGVAPGLAQRLEREAPLQEECRRGPYDESP